MRGLIIVPAFNEEAALPETLASLDRRPEGWDVIVIDDGSRDNTAQVAREAGYRCVSLPMNLGIGTAVQTGYRVGRSGDYDCTLQFDGDGQHLVDEIPKLVGALDGNSCVVGSRYLDDGYEAPVFRRLGARWFSWLLGGLGCRNVTDPSSGFRLCDRRATAFFADRYPLDYPEVEARLLLARRELPVREVPVKMSARRGGESSIGPFDALFYLVRVSLALVVGGGR